MNLQFDLYLCSLREQLDTLGTQAEELRNQIAILEHANVEQQKTARWRNSHHAETSNLRRYHSFENGFLDRITDTPESPFAAEVQRSVL